MLNAEKLDSANLTISTLFNRDLELTEDPIRKALAMEVSSNSSSEEYVSMGDVPGLQERQGDRIVEQLRAESMNLKNRKYWTGFRIPMDHVKDDKLGLHKPKVAEMANKAGMHYGVLLGELLAAGRTTDLGVCLDGHPLISENHQDGDGPVQSNLGTAGLDLTSYKAARATMHKYKDETGKYSAGVRPSHLIVGPDYEGVALEIVKATTIDNAAGTASKSNVYQGSAEVIVLDSLVDAFSNYWFLGALNGPLLPLILQIREAITMTAMNNPNDPNVFWQDDAIWGVDGRHAVGYGSWRRIWGSNGAG